MKYQPDVSGINSLAGFAYQIKVFAYYIFDLKEGMQIEFETVDDVNIKNFNHTKIDSNSQNFVTKFKEKESNVAIQVKRTDITNSVAQQVLLNWILLESSEKNISKYILFTEKSYGNKDILFSRNKEVFYQYIMDSNLKANATISKVKKLYKDKFEEFEKTYDRIQDNYSFCELDDIDLKIDEKGTEIFRKAANEVVYYQRLHEFLQHITVQIIEFIENKKPYELTYTDFIKSVEDICCRLTETTTAPLYSEFKKMNTIDLADSKLAKSREYVQLLACELPKNLMEQHLLYGMYYQATSLKYMENNRVNRIIDIEETTFENYQNVKFALQKRKNDEPYNRLEETKKMPNSFSENQQIRYGSTIHLTKIDIGEHQISWEDEDNEKR